MASRPLRPLPQLIFASGPTQLPPYLGPIVDQGRRVRPFRVELARRDRTAMDGEQATSTPIEAIHIAFPLSAMSIAAEERIPTAPNGRPARASSGLHTLH